MGSGVEEGDGKKRTTIEGVFNDMMTLHLLT